MTLITLKSSLDSKSVPLLNKNHYQVNDGYFVHFYAPSDLPPLNKHVVFVLDTSGSMMDRKIVQLREAMQTILSELNPGDYFSIVEFASSVMVSAVRSRGC